MSPQDLVKKIKSGHAPVIIDVRSGVEYRSGHVPGAIHAPLLKVLLRLVKLPQDRSQVLVLTCEHGPRAQVVKTVLSRAGYTALELLDGHMSGWRRANLPLDK